MTEPNPEPVPARLLAQLEERIGRVVDVPPPDPEKAGRFIVRTLLQERLLDWLFFQLDLVDLPAADFDTLGATVSDAIVERFPEAADRLTDIEWSLQLGSPSIARVLVLNLLPALSGGGEDVGLFLLEQLAKDGALVRFIQAHEIRPDDSWTVDQLGEAIQDAIRSRYADGPAMLKWFASALRVRPFFRQPY